VLKCRCCPANYGKNLSKTCLGSVPTNLRVELLPEFGNRIYLHLHGKNHVFHKAWLQVSLGCCPAFHVCLRPLLVMEGINAAWCVFLLLGCCPGKEITCVWFCMPIMERILVLPILERAHVSLISVLQLYSTSYQISYVMPQILLDTKY